MIKFTIETGTDLSYLDAHMEYMTDDQLTDILHRLAAGQRPREGQRRQMAVFDTLSTAIIRYGHSAVLDHLNQRQKKVA